MVLLSMVTMSRNEPPYYPAHTSGPGWQQPGHSGPPQNQGPLLHPENRIQQFSHQNVGQRSFTAQNQGPQFTPQNQGPAYPQNQGPTHNLGPSCPPQNKYPLQNQGPCYPTQNQGPSSPPKNQRPQCHLQNPGPPCPQNQGPTFSPQNQGSSIPPLHQAPFFPPQNQGPLYPSHDQGPLVLPQNQGQNQQPPFPTQTQGPQVPAQNLCPSQNQGSFFPPQNQGAEYPVQNLGPIGPPENRGPQFPPQNQGVPIHQQNHVHLGPRQNHLFPPQNQGLPCPAQNKGFSGPPQNQGPPCPILNPGPPIPPQDQRLLFTPRNQGTMCPPQNQRPIFLSQNQGPLFPLQNQDTGPRLPQNNGPSFSPCTWSPAYPQQTDNWESLEEYPDYEENCGNHGDDWSNQNGEYDNSWSNQNEEYNDNWNNKNYEYDDKWSNQNDDPDDNWINQNDNHEGDWRTPLPNPCAPSTVRGCRKVFFKKGIKKNDFKEAPLIKKPRISPQKDVHQYSKPSSLKQCSNNILVNIVKTADLNSRTKPQCSNLKINKLNSSTITSKQSLQRFNLSSEQKYVCTKPKQDKCNLKVNENSTQNKVQQSQKTNQAQVKEIGCRFKNTNRDSSATSNLQKNNLQSKLIPKISSPSLNQLNKQVKCISMSNEMTVQCKDKPTQKLNSLQENNIQSTKRDPVLSSNDHEDVKQSQLIQKTSTGNDKEVEKHDYVDSKIYYLSSVKLNNSLLQCNNKEFRKTNKTQAKEGLEHSKSNSSSTLKKKTSPTNNSGESQETSTVQQEKHCPILTLDGLKDDNTQIHNTYAESAKEVEKHFNVEPKLNNSSNVKLNNSLLQSNNVGSSKTNKVQAKDRIFTISENTTSDLCSTLNKKKSPLNGHGKSQKTVNVQREKLRSSKRSNPQNETPDDSNSISTKRIKISDKDISKEEQHDPSKVVAVDTDIKSKPEMQDKVKGTSTSDERVKVMETAVDKMSILQPKDEFEANPKIKIENMSEVKPNEAKHLCQLKETSSISNKITQNNQSTVVSQTNKTVVESCKENPNKSLNIKTEPDCSIINAGDLVNERGTNNVQKMANTMSDHAEIISKILVQNDTNASEICSIAPDSSGNINAEPSQSDFNYKSQNSDTKIDCQPLNDDSQNSSDFSDVINPLEANLREFDILDEVEGSDGDEGDQSTISSGESDSEASDQEDCHVDIDDIDAMLEEGLPTNQKDTYSKAPKKLRHKVILEEIGHDHFDFLPEGWIQIIHNSGMPVYLQQKARVCTMSRPYFLGPGSARSHKIPLSAIPCLQYKRALEIEKKYEEENLKKQAKADAEQTNKNPPPLLPVISAKIETAEENEAAQSLDPTELQKYCKKVFNFKTISIIPFKSWGDRRKFARMTKDIKKQQRPLLPSGTKLLKFPIHNPDGTISKSKGEWVINPNGKSYVCILHEYVQHALKQHPKYQFKELKNPATPYSATVYIGEMQYGTGMGASKKHAKLEAAKAALEVLIPEMKDKIERDSEFGMHSGIAKRSQNYENSIFDQIHIEDPRVAEFCAKTTEPPPYAILATCLQRNGMGLGEVKVEYNMNTKRHKEDEFKMTVRNHTAVVLCKNKRDGKQKAAQAILKALHPNIEHFGSLLRMYGNHSIKSVKEKKQEEQEITGLQCKAAVNQPNLAILNKLQHEMRKLAVNRKEQLAKGKFLCQNVLPTASSTDLNKINL